MRAHRSVSMLAATAAITLAGTTPAYAFDSQGPGGGPRPTPAVIQHHPTNSPDWLLIGLTGGAITLTAAGIAASQAIKHTTRTPAGA